MIIFHSPGDIPAGQVKVRSVRDLAANNFGAGRGSKGRFVGTKERLAIAWLRINPKQGPKRPPMHHAEAVVVIGRNSQGVDIVAPY